MCNFLKYLGLFLWQLPQNIVALVMYPFLGKKEVVKKENGTTAYSAKNMRGGISLGNFIFLSEYSAKRKETVAHEFGHCKQSRMLGWLYLIVIGIPSLCWAAFKPAKKCYYSFYTESWANKNAGLIVKETPYGCQIAFPEPEKPKKVSEMSLSEKMELLSRRK